MVDPDTQNSLPKQIRSALYQHIVNIHSVWCYMSQPGRPHKDILINNTLKCIPIGIVFWTLLTLVVPGKPFNTHKIFKSICIGALFGLVNSFRYTSRKIDLWTVQSMN